MRLLAETFDLKPAIVGWSQRRPQRSHRRDAAHHPSLLRLPIDGSSAGRSFTARSDGLAAVAQPRPHARRLRLRSPRPAPEAFLSKSTSSNRAQASHVQELPTLPIGKTEVVSWKSTDGREVEGLLTYPGRLPDGQARAAAGRDSRRADRRVHADVHRQPRPVPGRRVRLARVRRAALQRARQQRLRQGIPVRQLQRLGRRRLSRHHRRRRRPDRTRRRRPGAAGRDGLELRGLHDLVDHHANPAASRPPRWGPA